MPVVTSPTLTKSRFNPTIEFKLSQIVFSLVTVVSTLPIFLAFVVNPLLVAKSLITSPICLMFARSDSKSKPSE